MAGARMTSIMPQLRKIVLAQGGGDLTDGHLLECFISQREEAAFRALVKRHGPMVMGVCRRVLRNDHDAEDAFQATFLVLVQKAASIVPRELVGNWLYGVAYRTAMKARTAISRRRGREKPMDIMPADEKNREADWSEMQAVLDQELHALPDKYRTAIILCDLEGKTAKAVARQLDIPEGTVASRLARAREKLRTRLIRRGLTLGAGVLAGTLAQNATAAVPTVLAASTVKAGMLLSVGKAATGIVSLQASALAEGVLKTMLLHKLKIATAVLLAITLVGTGGGVVRYHLLAAPAKNKSQEESPRAANNAPAKAAAAPKDRELTTPFIKWAAREDFITNDPHDPLVVKGTVVVGTDRGELRAYRCTDGESLWTHQHGKRIYYHPCSDGERIYFTSEDGVTAVAAADGTMVWSFDSTSCDGPVIVLDKKGTVYVGGNDGNVYALDAKTGKQQWKSDFIADAPPDRPGFAGARARLANTLARPSALTSDGEKLFLSVFDQSRVVVMNASSGNRLWSFQAGGWIFGAAVSTEKHLFFGSQDNNFYCLDKQTGKQVWRHTTKARIESGGVVDWKFVYFGSCDGSVYCLNQSDGKERWRFATDLREDGRKSPIYSVPVLPRGSIYFAAAEGQMYAVDRYKGTLKWKIRPSEGSDLYCSPATDGTLIFLVTRARDKEHGEPSLVGIGLK